MRFLPILTFLVYLTTSLPVMAKAPINDEGAAKVKSLVQGMIDQQSLAHTSSLSKFVKDGEIKVEQAENYYAVTLPDITVVSQHEKDGETKKLITKIGIIGMNVIPTDNEKEWKMSVAIPTPIKYLDENQKIIMQMDIGQQQMLGIWNEDLNAFANFKGQYRDLLFHNDKASNNTKVRVKIDEFEMKSTVTEGSNKLWSGPSNITLSNFIVETQSEIDSNFVPNVKIDQINLVGSVKDYAPESQSKLQELVNSMNAQGTPDPSKVTDMLPLLLNMADSMAFKMSLQGLKISPSANMLTQDSLVLQEAFFGFGIHGLKQKMLSNNFNFGWHGLSGTKEQAKDNNTIPTTMSFSFALDKLPLEPLINMGKQLASSGANKDNIAQMAMMNAMMTLPQKLSEAGTTISIKDTMLKHPHYKLNFDGHLKADQASIIGVNGEATVKALGIDNAITLLQKQKAENAANPVKEAKIAKLISQLETLEKLVQDDPNGSDLKTAKFVLDNQGQTLVNGVNIKEIAGETVVLD